MSPKRLTRVILALSIFLALFVAMPTRKAQSECLAGLCRQKFCTESCCGGEVNFIHYILEPSSWKQANKKWWYEYKLCPGACEDTYPFSQCLNSTGCREIF